MAEGYAQDILTRIVNVHWQDGPSRATLSLGFSATPTGLYKDGTPTVATLSVKNLPPLSPSTFKVNLPEGLTPPPFFPEADYGGSTQLTMPDGNGTLTADWMLQQRLAHGAVFGQVDYDSSTTDPGSWEPFLGENVIQIKVVLNLRPLDFLSLVSADNHYDWQAFAVAGIPGISAPDTPMSYSGRAETAQTLTFILDVVMDPPRATFKAGAT